VGKNLSITIYETNIHNMEVLLMKRRLCNPNRVLIMLSLVALPLFSLSALTPGSTIVDPSRFIFSVKPGGRTTGAIKVTNPGQTIARVNAVVYDWTLNREDKMVTTPAGTRKESLKGCIKFNPRNFKLAPGASQIVRFTLTAPTGGGYLERRGVVFFEEHLAHNPKQPGANVVTQVGATIYLGLQGMKMGFNAENVTVRKTSAKKRRAALDVTNSGEGHIRYRITYKLVNAKGALVKREQLAEHVLLPQSKRKVHFVLPVLKPGKYNLLCSFYFYGTDKTFSRTAAFTVD
jgi:P pilus assembly chaperone PapD